MIGKFCLQFDQICCAAQMRPLMCPNSLTRLLQEHANVAWDAVFERAKALDSCLYGAFSCPKQIWRPPWSSRLNI